MYLLILFAIHLLMYAMMYLHPTMYLLILYARFLTDFSSPFTSHYVSINSSQNENVKPQIVTFTSHYVSINSEVLIMVLAAISLFTSHYVSINSLPRKAIYKMLLHLHPTMYLLIPLQPLYHQQP